MSTTPTIHPSSESNTTAARAAERSAAQKFWENYFKFYDTLNVYIPYRRLLERQASLLEPLQGTATLDAGTGTGNLAQIMAARGADVIGIDFCEPALDRCRRKVRRAEFRFGDLTQPLSFEPATFDRLACCLVLHLLPPASQQLALEEFFRVLKPGGVAVINAFVRGFNPITAHLEALRQQWRSSGALGTLWFALRYSFDTVRILYYVFRVTRGQKQGQHNFLTPEILGPMLTRAGFTDLRFELMFADQCLTAVARKTKR